MDLKPLFEMQKALDDRIIEEKGLEGQDLFFNTVLALLVEVSECANEWRGFKHWSEDQEPRKGLLEEYVDGLHFVLSLGLQIDKTEPWINLDFFNLKSLSITEQFLLVSEEILKMRYGQGYYEDLINTFLCLGSMLGFTWEQIEQAYKEKNATNHLRQSSGY
jgi:dimeric dUTPase (all-alpha-NTP-PPase superfamily)